MNGFSPLNSTAESNEGNPHLDYHRGNLFGCRNCHHNLFKQAQTGIELRLARSIAIRVSATGPPQEIVLQGRESYRSRLATFQTTKKAHLYHVRTFGGAWFDNWPTRDRLVNGHQ